MANDSTSNNGQKPDEVAMPDRVVGPESMPEYRGHPKLRDGQIRKLSRNELAQVAEDLDQQISLLWNRLKRSESSVRVAEEFGGQFNQTRQMLDEQSKNAAKAWDEAKRINQLLVEETARSSELQHAVERGEARLTEMLSAQEAERVRVDQSLAAKESDRRALEARIQRLENELANVREQLAQASQAAAQRSEAPPKPVETGPWQSRLVTEGPLVRIEGSWRLTDPFLRETALMTGRPPAFSAQKPECSVMFLGKDPAASSPDQALIDACLRHGPVLIVKQTGDPEAKGPVIRRNQNDPEGLILLETVSWWRQFSGDAELSLRVRRDVTWALHRLGLSTPVVYLLDPQFAEAFCWCEFGVRVAIPRATPPAQSDVDFVNSGLRKAFEMADGLIVPENEVAAPTPPGSPRPLSWTSEGPPPSLYSGEVTRAGRLPLSVERQVLLEHFRNISPGEDVLGWISRDWANANHARKSDQSRGHRLMIPVARLVRQVFGPRHVTARNALYDLVTGKRSTKNDTALMLVRAASDFDMADEPINNYRTYWAARLWAEGALRTGDAVSRFRAAELELRASSDESTVPAFRLETYLRAADAAFTVGETDVSDRLMKVAREFAGARGLQLSSDELSAAFVERYRDALSLA